MRWLVLLLLLLTLAPCQANEIEDYLVQQIEKWANEAKEGRGTPMALLLVQGSSELDKHEQTKVLKEARAAAERNKDLLGVGIIDFLLTAQLPDGSPASVKSARSALAHLPQPPAEVRALLLYRWSFISRPATIGPELDKLKVELGQAPETLSRLLLANGYLKVRRWSEVAQQLEFAAKHIQTADHWGLYWDARAELAQGQKDGPGALEARRQALEQYRQTGEPKKILQARLNLANTFADLGHWTEAQTLFQEIDNELPSDDENRGIFTKNWANFHLAYADYERSRELNEAAVDFYQRYKKPRELAEALAGLGEVNVELEAFRQAEEALDQAQRLARELDYQLLWASTARVWVI